MNYEKAWRTLKAESGYRITKAAFREDILSSLMDKIEERVEEEETRKKNTVD